MQDQHNFPQLNPPYGLEIWRLGLKWNWSSQLSVRLNQFKDFFIVDSISEDHLHSVLQSISESTDSQGWDILHYSVSSCCNGENGEPVKSLLALGLSPNQQTKNRNWTPAHLCSIDRRSKCTEVIGFCRPDLTGRDNDGKTPVDCALERGWNPNPWDRFVKNGFPTIAELACHKDWWAVQNLCRRRVVPKEEKYAEYAGRDSIGWAGHFGESRIAQELRYLLVPSPEQITQLVTNLQSALPEESRKVLQQNVIDFEFDEQMGSIADEPVTESEANVEVDTGGVKESLALCATTHFDHDSDQLKGEPTATQRELQEMEDKLLSKVDGKFKEFQRGIQQQLSQALNARDDVWEARLKVIREEIAKQNLEPVTRCSGWSPPTSFGDSMVACGTMTGSGCVPSTRNRPAASGTSPDEPFMKELLTLFDKYRQ